MRIQSLVVTAIFASLTLYATAAVACPWNDASAQSDPTVVAAAGSPDQTSAPATTQQTPPASAN